MRKGTRWGLIAGLGALCIVAQVGAQDEGWGTHTSESVRAFRKR
ncbi:MAG: hypothetical protein M5R38_18270 [Candidatus Methylomirabilis sp.]|nr:hypothetical protein [Candidatus Methylomirabilis sp.]